MTIDSNDQTPELVITTTGTVKEMPPSRADSGMGAEDIDESTRLADVTYDQKSVDLLTRAQKRPLAYWLLLFVVMFALGEQTGLGYTLYSFALGEFAALYPGANVVWVMTALLLGGAVVAPLAAKLGDVYGKKRILMCAAAVLAIGCVVCALAPNFVVLIIGRILMASSTAFVFLVVALIRDTFPVRLRAVTIGLITTGGGLLVLIGPLLSSALVNAWGMPATFWFQFATTVVFGVIGLFLLPESPVRVRTGIDYAGALLLGLGMFGILGGLTQIQTLGWGLVTIGLTIVGVLCLAGWWLRSRYAKEPLINLALLTRRAMVTPIAVMALAGSASSILQVVPILAWSLPEGSSSYARGLTQFDIAMWAIPYGVLSLLAGLVVGATVKSIGYRAHLIFGSLLLGSGALLLGLFPQAPVGLMIVMYAMACGFGFVGASTVSLVMLAAPEDQRTISLGMNGSINSIFSSASGQIGYAVIGVGAGMSVGGYLVYSEGSILAAFAVSAAFALAAAVVAIFVPHGRPARSRR